MRVVWLAGLGIFWKSFAESRTSADRQPVDQCVSGGGIDVLGLGGMDEENEAKEC
jgi:hypothetical protein